MPLRETPPAPYPAADLEIDPRVHPALSWRRSLVVATGWLVSLTLHGGLLVVLGLWLWPWAQARQPETLLAHRGLPDDPLPLETLFPAMGADIRISPAAATEPARPRLPGLPALAPPLAHAPSPPAAATPSGNDLTIPRTGLGDAGAAPPGSGLADRAARRQGAAGQGATGESERAVARALRWLAEHQAQDGSWSLDHRCDACRGACSHPGRLAPSHRAGTALALLTFLGAGQSHSEGKYQTEVQQGLQYLMSQQHPSGSLMDVDLQLRRQQRGVTEVLVVPQGNLYSHGLASLALCEAYGMEAPRKGPQARQFNTRLRVAAEAALRFTSYAQDPRGGGWRYLPRPLAGGDLSVTGWQLMALKSGQLAGLDVDPATLAAATRFLDAAGNAATGRYQYRPSPPAAIGSRPQKPALFRETTTAIGLLCRMYLGWDRTHPSLERGTNFLAERGPSLPNRPESGPAVARGNWALTGEQVGEVGPADETSDSEPPAAGRIDLYENYYATLVLFHFTGGKGPQWEAWHQPLRDYLVDSQNRRRHAKGSWFFSHRGSANAAAGGRLYCTCLAAMTLEVYYRYAPLYRLQTQPVRGVQTAAPNL